MRPVLKSLLAAAVIVLPCVGAVAAPTIVSPADYATVKTVSDKLYSDIHTSSYFAWSTFQKGTETGAFRQTGMAEYKTNSLPVRLQWGGTSGSSTVTVRRSRDNVAVFSTTTTGSSATFYDPEVGRNYTWTVENGGSTATGHFFTELRAPRIIYSDHDPSAQGSECSIGRDLGGWVTEDGAKVVKQGLIYRSAMMEYCNPGVERRPCDELIYLKNDIGIKLDIDLREVDWMNTYIIGNSDFEWSWGTLSIDMSNIGAGIPRFNVNQVCGVKFPDYGDFTKNAANKKAVWCAFTNFCSTARLPAIFHCAHGKDRTGSLAYVLLGALGVSEEDARRDFGLSWYADAKDDVYMTSSAGYPSLKTSSSSLYNTLPGGGSFQARCEAYLLSCGTAGAGLSTAAAQAKIDAFKALMLEDPETAATPPEPDPDPPAPVAPDIAIATNALPTVSWGYMVTHLGEYHNETAVVFTNGIATWTAPAALENVRFLVVGGGGGGGGDVNSGDGYQGGAGGGGGGVVTGVVYGIAQNATVLTTVGAGGAGGKAGTAVNNKFGAGKAGSASSIKVGGVTYVTANGGGQDQGATGKYSSGGQEGGSGGSSAGSRPKITSRGNATKGNIGSSVTSLLSAELFGNQGGAGNASVSYASGGGGGATEEGGTPSDYFTGGKGGEGLTSDITGASAVYGSGGGGGTALSAGAGGLGGTGAGDGHRTGKGKGENALPNRGGGGGGGGGQANGGNGGSGIVVLRYVSGEGVIVEDEVSAKILNPEYTGGVVSCSLAETAGYTVSGATATAAGDYTATVTPKAGYIWDDGTTAAKTFAWAVAASMPQVDGEDVAPAEVFTKAKTSKPIVYPSEPTVTGEAGAQVISFGGVDVNVPDYYTASKSGNVVSLVLNDNARPVIADEDETPGIAVVGGKVHIHLCNVKGALYYTILSATSLDSDNWTPCGEAEQGQDDFEYDASGTVRFYKASVRDEAE